MIDMDGKLPHEGNKLRGHTLNSVFELYKFLTPQTSESVQIKEFAEWHQLDPRTIKKYMEGQGGANPKQNDFNNNNQYFLNQFDPKRQWKSLEIVCRYCKSQSRGVDCHKCPPDYGCEHCKKCSNINICERKRDTGKVPRTCEVLKKLFRYLSKVENLTFVYFPLSYVFDLGKDNFAVEILDYHKDALVKLLGEKIDIKYVSCVIRYAHLYASNDKVSFLFLSRMLPEDMLKRVLRKIQPDEPIDNIRVQIWNKCDKFEKELLCAKKPPKYERNVDGLFKIIENDVSLADIMAFVHYFSVLPEFRLRPIDVRLLQRCLFWKACSLENFLQLCFAEP